MNYQELLKQSYFHHGLLATITNDGQCYIYTDTDIPKEVIPFHTISLNRNFHFSTESIIWGLNTLLPQIKECQDSIKVCWDNINQDSTLTDKAFPEEVFKFIEKVCRWGKIDRCIPSIKNTLDNSDQPKKAEDFVATLRNRLSSTDLNIECDYSKFDGIGKAVYSKTLRLINPDKFLVFDSIYAGFFKVTSYKTLHNAFSKVWEDLRKEDELRFLSLGDFEFLIFKIIQFCLISIQTDYRHSNEHKHWMGKVKSNSFEHSSCE